MSEIFGLENGRYTSNKMKETAKFLETKSFEEVQKEIMREFQEEKIKAIVNANTFTLTLDRGKTKFGSLQENIKNKVSALKHKDSPNPNFDKIITNFENKIKEAKTPYEKKDTLFQKNTYIILSALKEFGTLCDKNPGLIDEIAGANTDKKDSLIKLKDFCKDCNENSGLADTENMFLITLYQKFAQEYRGNEGSYGVDGVVGPYTMRAILKDLAKAQKFITNNPTPNPNNPDNPIPNPNENLEEKIEAQRVALSRRAYTLKEKIAGKKQELNNEPNKLQNLTILDENITKNVLNHIEGTTKPTKEIVDQSSKKLDEYEKEYEKILNNTEVDNDIERKKQLLLIDINETLEEIQNSIDKETNPDKKQKLIDLKKQMEEMITFLNSTTLDNATIEGMQSKLAEYQKEYKKIIESGTNNNNDNDNDNNNDNTNNDNSENNNQQKEKVTKLETQKDFLKDKLQIGDKKLKIKDQVIADGRRGLNKLNDAMNNKAKTKDFTSEMISTFKYLKNFKNISTPIFKYDNVEKTYDDIKDEICSHVVLFDDNIEKCFKPKKLKNLNKDTPEYKIFINEKRTELINGLKDWFDECVEKGNIVENFTTDHFLLGTGVFSNTKIGE